MAPALVDAGNAAASSDQIIDPTDPAQFANQLNANPSWSVPSSILGINLGNAGHMLGTVLQNSVKTAVNNGFNPFDLGSYAKVTQAIPGAAIQQLGMLSPEWATIANNTSLTDTIGKDIAAGNWGGVAAAAVTGAAVPYLADKVLAYFSKKVRQSLGIIPPAPRDLTVGEADIADSYNSAIATRLEIPKAGNVGHKGHMEAFLGPGDPGDNTMLRFEIPPATHSLLSIHGQSPGQITPGAQAGISFKHVQNYASMLIPGSSPVYQSLGIQGHMIEFVGAFLGFNHHDPLHSNKTESYEPLRDANGNKIHEKNPNDPYGGLRDKPKPGGLNDNFNPNNPDPLYTGTSADKQQWGSILANAPKTNNGGAWGISKAFEQHVEAGMPQTFMLLSGVVRIRYTVIVLSLERLYQRDDRVYYKFQGLALDGGETDDRASRVQVARNNALPSKTRDGRTTKKIGKNGTGVTQGDVPYGPPDPSRSSKTGSSAPSKRVRGSTTTVDYALGANTPMVLLADILGQPGSNKPYPGNLGQQIFGHPEDSDGGVLGLKDQIDIYLKNEPAVLTGRLGAYASVVNTEGYTLVVKQFNKCNALIKQALNQIQTAESIEGRLPAGEVKTNYTHDVKKYRELRNEYVKAYNDSYDFFKLNLKFVSTNRLPNII